MRIWFATALLFGILYAMITLICTYLGFGTTLLFAMFAVVVVLVQYIVGPIIVEKSMGVRYVSLQEAPNLRAMVDELAMNAGIPKPKVGISQVAVPNAFAFGRSIKDGRICITSGMRQLLNKEELRAVIGHELSHIKHRDMIVITVLSVIPLILPQSYNKFHS